MSDRSRSGPTPGTFFGLVAVLFGTLLLLRNLDIVPRATVFFWPVLLVLAGLTNVFLLHGRLAKIWGALLLAAGIYLGMDRLGLAPFRFTEILPVFLIAFGGSLLWRALRPGPEGRGDPLSTLNEFAIFGGVNRRLNSRDFRGGEVFAAFGGHEIDLRNAGMERDEASLEVNVIFGGIEVMVPTDWEVAVQGAAIFGGYEDKTLSPKLDAGVEPKRLIIRGYAICGGVEVKN